MTPSRMQTHEFWFFLSGIVESREHFLHCWNISGWQKSYKSMMKRLRRPVAFRWMLLESQVQAKTAW